MNGRPSPRRRKEYSRESIAHALAHHESRGALRSVSPPEPGGRSTWRVVLAKFPLDPKELTEPQAYALCLGLAASEDQARVEHDKFVADLKAYNEGEPPCVVDEHTDELLHLRRLVRIADSVLQSHLAPLGALTVITDSAQLTQALERALRSAVLPAGTRCGVHGTDTSSGRCASCDEACGFRWREALQPGEQAAEGEQFVWRTCTLQKGHVEPIDHHDMNAPNALLPAVGS